MTFRFSLSFIVFALAVFSLAACSSTTRNYKAIYAATQDVDDLDIPPGLSTPETGAEPLPELERNIKTYTGYEESVKGKPASRFEREYEGMNFVRGGSLFWLEINTPSDAVWGDLRNFFKRLGFDFEIERPQIGFFETNWLANKESLPSNILTSLLDNVFSSSEIMDKYRIRLEWDAEKKISRVFINHQGLREIVEGVDDNVSVVQTKWVRRPSDPELEVELLMRFMAFRGLNVSVAEKNIKAAVKSKVAEVSLVDNKPQLTIYEPFARSWRHVGIAIDRLGYSIDDKNRSAGVYYISLPETFEVSKESGVFGKLFTSNKEAPKHLKYLIILEDDGESTKVKIKANGDVTDDISRVEKKILADLQSSIL